MGPLPPAPSPLIPLAVGLVTGLVAAGTEWAALLAAPLLVLACASQRWRPLLLGALLGLLLGRDPGASRVPPAVHPPPRGTLHEIEGLVREAPPPTPNGARAVIAVDRIGRRSLPDAPLVVRAALGPGVSPPFLPGDRVRLIARLRPLPRPTNPGALDIGAIWRRQGIHLRTWIDSPSAVERVEAGQGVATGIAALRHAAARVLDRGLSGPNAGLARALLLGDRGRLADADRARFSRTGQGHLIAVSGLHVGLLLAGLVLVLRRVGLGWRAVALVTLAATSVYVPLAGAPPSAIRAGAGAALCLVGILLGRTASPACVLSTVVVGVLVCDPQGLARPALTLSLAAVLSILLLAPRLTRWLLGPALPVVPGLIEAPRAPLRRSLAVALAAWLGTTPLLAAYLGRICPAAAPLSVVAVPITALLIGTGIAHVLLAGVPLLAPLAAGAFEALAACLRRVLDVANTLGLGAVPVPAPTATWHAVYVLAALALAFARRRFAAAAAAVLCGLLVALLARPAGEPPGHPQLCVLDVGHGQAVVLRLPDGRTALLDAGRIGDPDVGRRVVVPALLALGVRRIQLAVASHGDSDHAAGIPAVAAALPVERVVVPPGLPPHQLRRLERAGLSPETASRGRTLLQGAWGRLDVLAPRVPLAPGRSSNDGSLVLRLRTAAGRSALFPGDIQAAGADDWLRVETDAHAELLLLPHHGHPGGASTRLVHATGAGTLIASCARPALAQLPAGARSTARSGALLIDLRPEGIDLRTPWAPAAREYNSPRRMPLLSQPPSFLLVICVGIALLGVAWLSARRLGWLTAGGALGAWVLGVTVFVAFGFAGLVATGMPTVIATLLGRLPGARPSGARNLGQVAANGVPALVGALLSVSGAPDVGLAVFLGALATLGADTCATEIGVRYGGIPRSIATGQPVRPGESGGVSLVGFGAMLAGALLAPGAFGILGGLASAGVGWAALAGVAGALVDSVLGATLQYRGRDPATGQVTERRRTAAGLSERISGWAWLDNDGVNLVSGAVGALVALALV